MKPISMFILMVATQLLATQVACAEEVQVQYRLVGLFQPDRVDDLKRQAGAMPANNNPAVNVPIEVKLASVDYETALVTFSYDSEGQNFKNRKPEQVYEHIRNLLQNASRGTFNVFPLSTLKPDQLKEERITVAGLDCKGCAYGAYRAVFAIDGVERAIVSFKEGHVTARFDPAKTSRQALVEALKQAQVDVTPP